MSLDYEKAKKKSEGDGSSALGFISDLFAALTFVFLFLFVIILLQNNTHSTHVKRKEIQLTDKYDKKMGKIIEEFDAQKKLMEVNAVEFIEGHASKNEKELYSKLTNTMDKVAEQKNKEILKREKEIREQLNNIEKAKLKLKEMDNLENLVQKIAHKNLAFKAKTLAEKDMALAEADKRQEQLLEKAEKEKNTLRKSLEEKFQVQSIAKEKEIEKIKAEYQKKIDELKKLNDNRSQQYVEKIESKEILLANSQVKLFESSQKNKDLKTENQNISKELKKLSKQITKLKQDKKENYETSLSSQKTIANMDQKIQLLQKKINEIEATNKLSAAKNKDLDSEKNELEDDILVFSNKFTTIKKQLSSLNEKNKQLHLINEKITKQNNDLNNRLEIVEAELSKTQSEWESAKNKNLALSKNMDRVEQDKNGLAKKIENIGSEMHGLQDKLFTYKETISDLMAEKEKMNGINSALESVKSDLELESQNLGKRVDSLLAKIDSLEKKGEQKDGAISKLEGKHSKLANRFGILNQKEEAKEKICTGLEKAFKHTGIVADIDKGSGEITIPFDDNYFSYDSAYLKVKMKEKLSKAIPIIAKTIFEQDKKSQVDSVEIIGYASPIYKGQKMEVGRIDKFGREGLKYNMDLSYRRAKSIFEFIFNPEKLKYPYQKRMLNLTQVSSNSYIESKLTKIPGVNEANIPGKLSKGRKFCKKYNCSDWHKVKIRFNID